MPPKTVRVIQPTLQRKGDGFIAPLAKRRVAAYARVSTEQDEQLGSFENQVRYFEQHIKSNPEWEFVGIYSDEGISGLSTAKRDGFNQMVADALAGNIDLILTKSISRFARNTVDSLSTIRKLKEAGIEVYFEKENIYTFDSKGELLLTIMASLSQEESRSISENVRWGQAQKRTRGEYGMSYGRFLGYEKGPDGKPQINEDEAEVVRRIYRMYLDGSNIREIARSLQQDNIPTPAGKNCNWQASTIASILRNEKYKGDALLQKTFVEDFLTKKIKKNEGELPQFYVSGGHPGIIDAETFDLVQAELIRRSGTDRGRHSDSPFDRKVICGDCGRFFGRRLWSSNAQGGTFVWRCSHKNNSTSECRTPVVRETVLQSAFLTAFNLLIGDRRDEYLSELEWEIASIVNQLEDGCSDEGEASTQGVQMARIRWYLDSLREQPDLITDFNADAFKALVGSIVVPPEEKTLIVRFKDGTEITVPRTRK